MTIEVSRAQLRKARLGVYFVALVALIFVIVFSIQVVKGLAGPISSMNWVIFENEIGRYLVHVGWAFPGHKPERS